MGIEYPLALHLDDTDDIIVFDVVGQRRFCQIRFGKQIVDQASEFFCDARKKRNVGGIGISFPF